MLLPNLPSCAPHVEPPAPPTPHDQANFGIKVPSAIASRHGPDGDRNESSADTSDRSAQHLRSRLRIQFWRRQIEFIYKIKISENKIVRMQPKTTPLVLDAMAQILLVENHEAVNEILCSAIQDAG